MKKLFAKTQNLKGASGWASGLALAMALALGIGLAAPAPAHAADAAMSDALMQKIQALEARVSQLESERAKALEAAAQAQEAAAQARKDSANSLKLSQELAKTKDDQPAGLLSDMGKRLKVYGAVELEGAYEKRDVKNGESSDDSRFSLATAEIFFEAAVNKYTTGVVHLLYEEGEDFTVDEAFILIGQTDDMPFYFMGGRMYPAIGLFETYMVSDPITQNAFETQAVAAEIGWAQDWFNISAGLFNSDVHETGDDPDSMINTYYARLQVEAPEGALGPDMGFTAGLAFTNNIAGGNLGEEVADQRVHELVAGWSAMASFSYKWVSLTGEYISAADEFKAGELGFTEGDAQPYAYNLELALMPIEDWTFAARYEGSGDMGSWEPESQWGLTVAWDLLPDTTLSLEYLRGEFENEDTRDLVTTQLAVAF